VGTYLSNCTASLQGGIQRQQALNYQNTQHHITEDMNLNKLFCLHDGSYICVIMAEVDVIFSCFWQIQKVTSVCYYKINQLMF
jgi:hypothetical protein